MISFVCMVLSLFSRRHLLCVMLSGVEEWRAHRSPFNSAQGDVILRLTCWIANSWTADLRRNHSRIILKELSCPPAS